MAWTPRGINNINQDTQGAVLIAILQSLAQELARLQAEIDELKRKQK